MAKTTGNGGAGKRGGAKAGGKGMAATGGDESFGQRIKRLRLAKGIGTGAALASQAGISAQAVYNYEADRHAAQPPTLQKLEKVLGHEVWGGGGQTGGGAQQSVVPIMSPAATVPTSQDSAGYGTDAQQTKQNAWADLLAARDAFCRQAGIKASAVKISVEV